jgi:hypothetical protein
VRGGGLSGGEQEVDEQAAVDVLAQVAGKGRCFYNEKRDNTHTSVHGATVYAGLVRDALLALDLVPEGAVRVG